MKIEELKEKLIVGAKVKIGKIYAKEHFCTEGEILELIEGHFEYDNGLYIEDQIAPAVWNEDEEDFDSIYHLFGNEFEYFYDCEIL